MVRASNLVTSDQLLELLKVKHSRDIIVPECKTGGTHIGGFRRMDLWVLRTSFTQHIFPAYEIKVSRGDFLQDQKWREYLDYCTEFYFVCPWQMIQREELPAEAGLMWASKNVARLYTKKKAPQRDVVPPVELFMYLLMSRVKITRERYGDPEDPLVYWGQWLKDRERKKDIGRGVSRKVSQHVAEMESKMHLLEVQNKKYAWVKEWLEELGINPHSHGWRDRLKTSVGGGVPRGLRRELRHAFRILGQLHKQLKEMER